ncbi:MAG: enoyl-CoA hydratase-related protein, partial [Alphaproteobacteria bacterium]
MGDASQDEPVLVRIDGPVARLSLNRPEQRNALSREMLDALQQALDRVDRAEGVRAVVLEGRGPAFSAGHDLREMSTAAPAEIEDLFRRCEGVMTTLHRVRVPVVASVHGIAKAAGCQLVAGCELGV